MSVFINHPMLPWVVCGFFSVICFYLACIVCVCVCVCVYVCMCVCLVFMRLTVFVSRWSGSHIRWGQPFRLRHVTTGKYLSLIEDKSLLLMDKEKADIKSTAFCFRSSKVQSPSIHNTVCLCSSYLNEGESLCGTIYFVICSFVQDGLSWY